MVLNQIRLNYAIFSQDLRSLLWDLVDAADQIVHPKPAQILYGYDKDKQPVIPASSSYGVSVVYRLNAFCNYIYMVANALPHESIYQLYQFLGENIKQCVQKINDDPKFEDISDEDIKNEIKRAINLDLMVQWSPKALIAGWLKNTVFGAAWLEQSLANIPKSNDIELILGAINPPASEASVDAFSDFDFQDLSSKLFSPL